MGRFCPWTLLRLVIMMTGDLHWCFRPTSRYKKSNPLAVLQELTLCCGRYGAIWLLHPPCTTLWHSQSCFSGKRAIYAYLPAVTLLRWRDWLDWDCRLVVSACTVTLEHNAPVTHSASCRYHVVFSRIYACCSHVIFMTTDPGDVITCPRAYSSASGWIHPRNEPCLYTTNGSQWYGEK